MSRVIFNFSNELQDILVACMAEMRSEFAILAPLVKVHYFWEPNAVRIAGAMEDYYEETGIYPDLVVIDGYLKENYRRRQCPEVYNEVHQYIEKLKRIDTSDWKWVKGLALKYCREREAASKANKTATPTIVDLSTEKLAARRKVAETIIGKAKLIDPAILEFTCPEGHERCWCYLDGAGVFCRCCGGAERNCWKPLADLANEINERLQEEGDDLLPVEAPSDPEKQTKLRELTNITRNTYRRIRPKVLEMRKTVADLEAASPIPVADVLPQRHFKLFLAKVLDTSTTSDSLWVGDRCQTGYEFRDHFRMPATWLKRTDRRRDGTLRQAPGPLFGLGYFKAGCYDRRSKNVVGQLLYNVEGDKMSLEEQTSIAFWLVSKFNVYAIVHSGHKSLHVLLNPPDRPECIKTKALLRGFNLDLSNFRWGGTARCPGWFRESEPEKGMTEGAWQRLVYLRSPSWIRRA